MMNPEIKAKWVAALRSGEYQQGTAHLRRGERFCCLGVLCDVTAPEKWESDVVGDWYHKQDFGRTSQLSGWMLDEVGLTQGQQVTLYTMNDDEGKTFAEIADYIEEYL